MKKLFFCLLILSGFISEAQLYNNEWIDHSKTYYKFKVGKTGLHRIPQSVIVAAGLGSTPAEYFQLWRNGAQVPIYTSTPSGPLAVNDFIEFWGEMNDGKPDKELYRKPEYQLNDKYSLQTDTATYFLTIDPVVSNNLRLRDVANNVAGNTLPAEPYFMHTAGNYFNKARLNNGYAVNVGETLYSSSYDIGEGYTSIEFNGLNRTELLNLFVYTGAGAPDSRFRIALSGNRVNPRRYRVKINGDSVLGKQMDYYNDSRESAVVRTSLLASNKATVEVSNINNVGTDRMVIHQYELTYPRQFNFGAEQNFEFTLPASSSGNYLEIRNFNFGGVAPVLYDITNGRRYTGNITTPSVVKVVLEPSLSERRLVLISQVAANSTSITSLESRNFTDYSLVNNQGNYIIITNSLLIPASGSNPIEEYKQYRSSVEGGSHNVIVALIDELVDQFAFGIKMHPMSIRNFLLYSRHKFTSKPKNVLLIGKGVNYQHHRTYENQPNLQRLSLVPTFGMPASDILLAADKGDSRPQLAIGRLSVINAGEISIYLNKLKEFEAAQRISSPLSKDKAWMKNIVHAVGSSEPSLQRILDYYMTGFKNIISDSLFAGKVYTFTKTSPESVQLMNNNYLDKLFAEGISLITYFGHSSTTSLEFNLNNPQAYNNKGKYPVFITLGCVAGDFYTYNTGRFVANQTISEKFVLAPERGTISFIASTNFGIPHYLDIWNSRFYKSFANTDYGKSLGENMLSAVEQTFSYTTQEDFYARSQCEATVLHGDPAIVLNAHAKPDYVIEDEFVRVEPGIVSIADQAFKLTTKVMNIGRAIDKDVVIEVKQEYPDKTVAVIYRDTLKITQFEKQLSIDIPINPLRDNGTNKLIITVDPENEIEEFYETNNAITREFVVYADEARPIYPRNFAIVNKQNFKFFASTANPLSASKTYRFQLDTTEAFNSSTLIQSELTSKGGVLEFTPTFSLKENSVYYWRVGPVPASGDIKWNTSSFIYLPNHDVGFNQSQMSQHNYSTKDRVGIEKANGFWRFDSISRNLNIKNGVLAVATGQASDISMAIDGDKIFMNSCDRNVLLFNILDPKSFKPVANPGGASGGAYGSNNNQACAGGRPEVIWNFEYSHMTTDGRNKARDFMDKIPDGYFVIVRNIMRISSPGGYAEDWKKDNGGVNTLYEKLKGVGFSDIDEFNKPRVFAFIYQKNNKDFIPVSQFSVDDRDVMMMDYNFRVPDSIGYITSPKFGPAKKWKQLFWEGQSLELPNTDEVAAEVIGVRKDGSTQIVMSNISPVDKAVDISGINANEFPIIMLKARVKDVVNYSPYQLTYWRVTYEPLPEGAIAPNLFFQLRDTFDVGEPADLRIAFKNVSDADFSDSIKVKMIITDNNNLKHTIPVDRQKAIISNDTLVLSKVIDTKNLAGFNTLFVDINPDNDQVELHRFNNFIYKNFYVRRDTLSPVLDVTFDNRHILNGDIVAAKPSILITLKDEAKWMLLDDTSIVRVQVRTPTNEVLSYHFNSDTLKLNSAKNGASQDNTAAIEFTPYFATDGDYELIITGQDRSGNSSGELEYRVGFKVVNKPMISNMLNYPNPFTTSTAFVFTITGSEVPQNLRIQILTVTGKVVKEITKEELGPLRVGRNITEYKWDGTDQYGQKLGNGVYLYRVITNHNGKALEKYKSSTENTDKYFNNGYGKMYLMR